MKITERVVKNTKPGTRDVFVWDTEIRGFGLRVKPSGKKSYLIQYRNTYGRSRRHTFGDAKVMIPGAARKKVLQLLAQVAAGDDPRADKIDALHVPTVRDLGTDYIERHATPNKRPASVANDTSMLERAILPRLGGVAVAAVTRRNIEVLHNALKATPYQANRVLAL